MAEIDEAAKAVQEVAKLGQTAVEHIGDLERIGQKLLGPFGQAYGILTDLVSYKREEIRWRLINRLAVYRLAEGKLVQRDIDIDQVTPVPLRIAYEYEEAIEREDCPELQQMWAQLLVNSVTGNLEPKKVYKEILTRLDLDAARIFNEIGMREKTVRAYFIVCGTDDGGTMLGVIPFGLESVSDVESSELFDFDASEEAIYCKIGDERLESIIDTLASIGIVYWDSDLHRAEDLLETDEKIQPSIDTLEFGKRVLANAQGIRVFRLSALGREFYQAVSANSD